MATGTGKTIVAFQICWKLWNSRWNRTGVLRHVVFSAPLRTRRERAQEVRRAQKGFFERYSEPARQVLNDILDKYIEYGTAEFKIPGIFNVPPVSERGTVLEIAAMFNGAENLRGAVNGMQTLLYAP